MVIDHICFAVRNLEEGIRLWKEAFDYIQYTEPVINTRQKVKVVFLKKENSLTIKIIEPTAGNVSLINFLSQGNNRFHHLCFKCKNLKNGITHLKEKGLRMLVPPQPGEAFENHQIAFLLAASSINIELIDTDDRAGVISNS